MANSLAWAFSFAAIGYYLGIGLAVIFHFGSSSRSPRFLALTAVTAVNLAVCIFIVWIDQQPIKLVSAIGLVAFAGALFGWALMASKRARLKLIFDPADPHQLVEQGPYKYIRHPFYASYCLFWIGCAIATWNPINIAFAFIIVPVFAIAAHNEERSFETTGLANSYAVYQRKTGFFWPKW